MKQWERILHFVVLLFVLFSLIGALFVPATVRFIFDDIFFPFGLIYLAVTFLKRPKWRLFILAFAAIAGWGLISDIIANGTIRIAPMGFLLRWLKWPILLLSVAELSQLKVKKEYVENTVVVSFLVMVGMNLLMMIDPFGIGENLSRIYTEKSELLLSNYHEFGAFRLSGMMRNPNTNAVLFALFLLFFLHSNAKKYWKFVLIAFVMIFLTQSRTVMLATLVIMAIFGMSKLSRKTSMVIVPVGALAVLGGLFLFRSRNLISIFDGSAFQSNSWTNRVDHYSVLFQSGLKDLVFGHGIVLDPIAATGFYFDSEYLSISYQYGLIGLMFWLAIIGFLAFIIRKGNKKSTYSWTLLVLIFGVAATNFNFLNVETATLMMILVGAWLFLQGENELSNDSQKEPY